jgi:outer membrane protein OmpA-like peptidoglycan-associated protein
MIGANKDFVMRNARLLLLLVLLSCVKPIPESAGTKQAEPKAIAASVPSDQDQDGIQDNDDTCPALAEDLDSFEDVDGCPEPDNDRDGVTDIDDKCPNDAEDKDEYQDEDGCPEKNPHILFGKSHHAEPLFVIFTKNQPKFDDASNNIIDEVIGNIRALGRPAIVIVEGRASSDEKNPEKLSKARAEAVRDYMLSKGIPADITIEIAAYGKTHLILFEGKENPNFNRRVDFVLKE